MDENSTPAPVDLGKTWDGVPITHGLAVFTNEMRVGLVEADRVRASDDGWFDVRYADGRRVMQNAERVATRFEGRNAAEQWAAEQGEAND